MRLQKLILMLSSDLDGEIVNAARAIGKELKSTGKDWHWLAGLAVNGEQPKAKAQERTTPPPPSDIFEIIVQCVEIIDRLSQRECDFVDGVSQRYEKYGYRTYVSDKQEKWLRDIHRRFYP